MCPGFRRKFSAFDDSETICSKNDQLYCSDEEITMYCPVEQSIKVWQELMIEMNPEFCRARGTGLNKQ
nr:hypothetical transcript [Hymenolepis microstoma]